MGIAKFEDIIAWIKAKELTVQIYALIENSKDFGFKDQIQRASVSIMNNIAEGFERKSNNEFRHFLYIAIGTCGGSFNAYNCTWAKKRLSFRI